MRRAAHRCPCGNPDVVETSPRLPDGTPFPTLYYLTCPRANAAASRLESTGRMREWQDELGTDPELAAAYLAAHGCRSNRTNYKPTSASAGTTAAPSRRGRFRSMAGGSKSTLATWCA